MRNRAFGQPGPTVALPDAEERRGDRLSEQGTVDLIPTGLILETLVLSGLVFMYPKLAGSIYAAPTAKKTRGYR